MADTVANKQKPQNIVIHLRWDIIQEWASRLLLLHAKALDMIVFLIGFSVGFYALATLLFIEPYVVLTATVRETPKLDTVTAEQLQVWLKTRQDMASHPMDVEARKYFVSSSELP